MIYFIMFLWCFTGVSSVIYWFSKDHNVYLGDLIPIIIYGFLLGPSAFIVGWFIHGDVRKIFEKVLIKKRRNRYED